MPLLRVQGLELVLSPTEGGRSKQQPLWAGALGRAGARHPSPGCAGPAGLQGPGVLVTVLGPALGLSEEGCSHGHVWVGSAGQGGAIGGGEGQEEGSGQEDGGDGGAQEAGGGGAQAQEAAAGAMQGAGVGIEEEVGQVGAA